MLLITSEVVGFHDHGACHAGNKDRRNYGNSQIGTKHVWKDFSHEGVAQLNRGAKLAEAAADVDRMLPIFMLKSGTQEGCHHVR